MSRISDIVLTDLRHQIADLGDGGGLISPSVYDTAQVIRMAPPDAGVWPALDWLLTQQQSDGGWGSPALPLTRAVPTLAAVLALARYGQRRAFIAAAGEGVAYLWREAERWAGPFPDDLPVGVELLLPRLLDEARAEGLALPADLYRPLIELGDRRRQLIAGVRLTRGTTPVHSWEAFGVEPDPSLLDATGSIGHSPAATAAWIRLAAGREDLAARVEHARSYLERAARATQADIPGVVPTAWPIDRFEQAYVMHTLLTADCLDRPELRPLVDPRLEELAAALGPNGLGYSDHFTPDGDDTAAAIAALKASGRQPAVDALGRFACGASFATYRGELQPSLITSARAVQALALCGHDVGEGRGYIASQQSRDGRWRRDKWNSSWLYATYQALLALGASFSRDALSRALDILLAHQQPDGSWCTIVSSELEETAYGVLICSLAQRYGLDGERLRSALRGARRWLSDHYRPFSPHVGRCWLAKEPYSPIRVARVIVLVALLQEAIFDAPANP